MPREIFGHVTDPPVSLGSRKWYTVPLSLAAHVAAIIPIVLVPLLATDVLPPLRDYDVFVVAPPAPPEPPAPPRPAQPKQPEAPRDPGVPLVAADKIGPEREITPAPPPDLGPGIAVGTIPGGHARGHRRASATAATSRAEASSSRRASQDTGEGPPCGTGVSHDRADREGGGRGHSRSGDRHRWEGAGRACAEVEGAARSGGDRCGESMGVHAEHTEWCARSRHHDGHRGVHPQQDNEEHQ